jgi:hypothetical protein
MSLRLPRNLDSGFRRASVPSPLEIEILAEQAASLGRAGKAVERIIASLARCTDASERPSRVQEAADALHAFLIQRELCGLVDHRFVIEHFAIPRDVLARVGARPKT